MSPDDAFEQVVPYGLLVFARDGTTCICICSKPPEVMSIGRKGYFALTSQWVVPKKVLRLRLFQGIWGVLVGLD